MCSNRVLDTKYLLATIGSVFVFQFYYLVLMWEIIINWYIVHVHLNLLSVINSSCIMYVY